MKEAVKNDTMPRLMSYRRCGPAALLTLDEKQLGNETETKKRGLQESMDQKRKELMETHVFLSSLFFVLLVFFVQRIGSCMYRFVSFCFVSSFLFLLSFSPFLCFVSRFSFSFYLLLLLCFLFLLPLSLSSSLLYLDQSSASSFSVLVGLFSHLAVPFFVPASASCCFLFFFFPPFVSTSVVQFRCFLTDRDFVCRCLSFFVGSSMKSSLFVSLCCVIVLLLFFCRCSQ